MKSIIVQHIEDYNKEHPEFTYKNSLSVSKCIEFLKEEFDADVVAANMVEKYYNQEGHKYYHMSADDILALWEDKRSKAIEKGKLFDSYVEQILEIQNPQQFQKWKIIEDIDNNSFMQTAILGFKNIIKFFKDTGYDTVIGTEIPLWIKHNEFIINGRCDCLLYNSKTKSYLVIDWKTNEEIKMSGFKKMKGPLKFISECEYHSYLTQVFFYKKALCETYKLADFDHIDVVICQMGYKDEPYYRIYKPGDSAYMFDTDLMNNIIRYCWAVKSYM